MRECGFCCEKLPATLRSDARYCSEECRHKAKRAIRQCSRCKLHHPSVLAPERVCAPCRMYDKIVEQKEEFLAVVGWMFDNQVCFYCGEHAVQKEHVVPQVTLYPSGIVPSCQECNLLAGAALHTNVLDKLMFIKDLRLKRYRKLLEMPEWSWDEIQDLGKNLRSLVVAAQKARDIIVSQVKWNPIALKEMMGL